MLHEGTGVLGVRGGGGARHPLLVRVGQADAHGVRGAGGAGAHPHMQIPKVVFGYELSVVGKNV